MSIGDIQMKSKSLLIRLSEEELEKIMLAYKNRLVDGDYISRSEYLRQLILAAVGRDENKGVF
jgi:hypothetical protein